MEKRKSKIVLVKEHAIGELHVLVFSCIKTLCLRIDLYQVGTLVKLHSCNNKEFQNRWLSILKDLSQCVMQFKRLEVCTYVIYLYCDDVKV